jgi:hypothetical protein
MSLAMFAAPFDDNIEGFDTNSDIMNKKRRAHTRTQKSHTKENFDTNKVNSVLEKIHNNLDNDDDDKDTFNPPPKAESAGVQKTKELKPESMISMGMSSNNDSMFRTLGRAPQPNYENTDNLDLNDYSNYGDKKSIEEYYKNILPGYMAQQNPANRPYYNSASFRDNLQGSNQDVLLQKLNYMITLLEDQQDERTNNVAEEVVLYSFLGIFIIFIADTFVRAGKYVR